MSKQRTKYVKNKNSDLSVVLNEEEPNFTKITSDTVARKKSLILGRNKKATKMQFDSSKKVPTEIDIESKLKIDSNRDRLNMLQRSQTTNSFYQSVDYATARRHKREKSHLYFNSTSRNQLQTIDELNSTQCIRGMAVNDSLNSESYNAICVLKKKEGAFNRHRYSMDQSALNTVRSSISSIVNLSEARNISKMRKQKPDEIE